MTGNFTPNSNGRMSSANETRVGAVSLPRTSRHWTLEETDAFAALYRDGKSLKDCCIIFGRTEKAAIKHMQQMGIVRTVNTRRSRGGRARALQPGPLPTEVAKLPHEPAPNASETGCLWIRGEPAARLFCGADRVSGSSWCAHHHVRAYDRASTVRALEIAGANTNEGATANG